MQSFATFILMGYLQSFATFILMGYSMQSFATFILMSYMQSFAAFILMGLTLKCLSVDPSPMKYILYPTTGKLNQMITTTLWPRVVTIFAQLHIYNI